MVDGSFDATASLKEVPLTPCKFLRNRYVDIGLALDLSMKGKLAPLQYCYAPNRPFGDQDLLNGGVLSGGIECGLEVVFKTKKYKKYVLVDGKGGGSMSGSVKGNLVRSSHDLGLDVGAVVGQMDLGVEGTVMLKGNEIFKLDWHKCVFDGFEIGPETITILDLQ